MNALANAAILSLPLTAVVWLALRLTPRSAVNAATRYLIWWLTLVVSLALPLSVTFHHDPVVADIRIPALDVAPSLTEVLPHPAPSPPPAPFRLPVHIPASRWIVIAWAFTSATLLFRLMLACRALRRARANAVALPDTCHLRDPRIRVADVPIPVAAREILIPAHLLQSLPQQDLDAIILHEAAHLDRRDDLAILAERMLIAIFPWHLAARWTVRQIDLEREIACDDRVVAQTGSPRDYAECLTRVVELCGGVRGPVVVPGMAGRRPNLSRRVEYLISTARSAGTTLLPKRLAPFAAGLLALAGFAAQAPNLLLFANPPKETVMKKPAMLVVAAIAAVAPPVVASPRPRPLPIPAQQTQSAPAPTPAETPGPAARQLLFFLDLPSLSDAELQRSVATLKRFVEKQIRAEDRVALMISASNGAPLVKQDFTADRTLLNRAIDSLQADNSELSPEYQLASLHTAIRMLGALPGKKTIVYLTNGYFRESLSPQVLRAVINDAARSNVAFFSIDVRGLVGQ